MASGPYRDVPPAGMAVSVGAVALVSSFIWSSPWVSVLAFSKAVAIAVALAVVAWLVQRRRFEREKVESGAPVAPEREVGDDRPPQ